MSAALRPDAFVQAILDQTEAFLLALPEGAYGVKVEAVGASIGSHLRHSLEHVDELLRGLDCGEVYFERRERNPELANSVAVGLAELKRLRQGMAQARVSERLQEAVSARSSLSGNLDESLAYASSIERELVYVGLHFTHHMALMAVAARLQGLPVPVDFGKAPATIAYERTLA